MVEGENFLPVNPSKEEVILEGYQDLVHSMVDRLALYFGLPTTPSLTFHLTTERERKHALDLLNEILTEHRRIDPIKEVNKKGIAYKQWSNTILNPLEAEVLTRRFGLSGDKRQSAKYVSIEMGYNNSARIRQIETKGIRKFRFAASRYNLNPEVYEVATSEEDAQDSNYQKFIQALKHAS